MNKHKMLKTVLTMILLIFIIPIFNVEASDGYYEVDEFNITVDILENGDAVIMEEITYDFDGNFNGILRDIDYDRTSGIKNITVGVLENGSITSFSESGGSGAYVYERDDTGSLAKLKIYEKSRNESKTFYIGYTLVNVAEKYNDIGTFNRKIIDDGWDIPLNNITITITIPEGATKEDLKVYAHGPLTGESEIVDNRTFRFTVPSVGGDFVETLAIFPPELIPDSTNVFAQDELPSILENEQQLADEANERRDEAIRELEEERQREERERTSRPIFGAGIAAALGTIFFMFRKFTKELEPEFMGDYYRELPEDYSPAVMSYLLSKGRTTDDDIMATILDLARKKVIRLTPIRTESGRIFKKEEDTFELTWLNKEKLDTLLPHEKFLATWFLDEIGDGRSLVIDDLETIMKKQKAALQFKKDYDYFKVKVKDTAEKQGFFTANTLQGAKIFVLLAALFILAGIFGIFFFGSFIAIGLAVLGGVLLMGLLSLNFIRKYTRRGVEHKAMWEAFRKFLKDFSNLKEAEIPSLVIWEHYLVYATSLGVAEEVIDQLPKVFNEAELSNPDLTYMGGYRSFNNFYIMNHAFGGTMSRVSSAVSSAQIANSSKSSGGGFGGGFSGGSSGGGGGGGGGGAF
ncbi:DUF2207 domain-containing protein [Proteiniclasticum sp.]|uniref:DUF2207 domain-containing protein n=1 Tax=Proteiniclasticum sp. TaxID=2053595 RepID=UPI0028A2BBF5|nr:DUF2207 domain-containing protein [Proteiniclasticum sp.]